MAEVIDNLFDPFFNKYVIDGLKSFSSWRICTDDIYEDHVGQFANSDKSDTGLVMQTFSIKDSDAFNSKLNSYADLILAKVLHSSQYFYNDVRVIRYFWNYYSKSSNGLEHRDIHEPTGNFASIVYYLNDCDGGTQVGNEFFENKESRAIIFNSKDLHKGFGPKESKQRFVLNIIFQYSDRQSKAPNVKTNRILL